MGVFCLSEYDSFQKEVLQAIELQMRGDHATQGMKIMSFKQATPAGSFSRVLRFVSGFELSPEL